MRVTIRVGDVGPVRVDVRTSVPIGAQQCETDEHGERGGREHGGAVMAANAGDVPDDLIAMPAPTAARFARVSQKQLRYWDETGLLSPGVKRQLSERNTVRLYSLPELVELRVIVTLLGLGMSLQRIRRIVDYLRREGHGAPLRELRFAVTGQEIYFQRPDGTWAGDRQPDQFVIDATITLPLERYRARIRRAAQARRRQDAGRIVRHRKVLGHKPVFAGTRVPVSAVMTYLERGLPDEEILEAFPQLTKADIAAARRHSNDGAVVA
jgi:uncharacterized protein (DUF433 family)